VKKSELVERPGYKHRCCSSCAELVLLLGPVFLRDAVLK